MSTNGNSDDDDTVSSTSTEDEKNNKKGDAMTEDVWENVSDRSFSASDDNDDDYDDNCNDIDDDDDGDDDEDDDHDDDNHDGVEKKDEQPRKKRKVKSLSLEEESVEKIFVHSCEATTKKFGFFNFFFIIIRKITGNK